MSFNWKYQFDDSGKIMFFEPIIQKEQIAAKNRKATEISLQYHPYWLFNFKTLIKGLFRSQNETIWFSVDDKNRRGFPCVVDPGSFKKGEPATSILAFNIERAEAEKIARGALLKREMKRRVLLKPPEVTLIDYLQIYYPFWSVVTVTRKN